MPVKGGDEDRLPEAAHKTQGGYTALTVYRLHYWSGTLHSGGDGNYTDYHRLKIKLSTTV